MAGANEVWARRLKEARIAAGLSQKQLGIEAGLDPSVASTRINRYELGVHKADLVIVQKLAKVLGVPVAYLYADDDGLARLIREYGQMSERRRAQILGMLSKSLP